MFTPTAARTVFTALMVSALLRTDARAQHAQMIKPLDVPMERMGSGTTWIPDASPLPSRQTMVGDWFVMFHGFLFAQYDKQGGVRGADQFGSLNWAMLMASHDLAGGRFQARTMLSLDPATVTARGYPLLLQSGETYRGQPLHDRQHPHDFWMELAVMYERALSSSLGVSAYAAPSGEPALGPVAFMHRPSAMDDPAAPLSHHWQDATHVSFGVLTAGVFGRRWKLEGSIFNGREPDEARWNFDPIRLDSYSGRITVRPDSTWVLSIGYGYLKSPEVLRPGEALHRLTASVLHGRRIGMEGQWATSVMWGANRQSGRLTQSALLESEANLDRRNTVFGRLELVQKTAEDLALPAGPGGFAAGSTFSLATVSLGYLREMARWSGSTLAVGVRGTINVVPTTLVTTYGSRSPAGVMVFLRLRPFHHAGPPEPMMMPGHD